MRSILLAAALACSTLVATVRTAEACGPYSWRPTAFAVTTPGVKNTKSFALMWDRLDEKRAANVTLARLDTMSFDSSSTAFNRRLPDGQKLTLLGPSGTKLFDAKSTVWLDLAFDRDDHAREAVVLPKGDFRIALHGHFKDATWTSFQEMHGSTVTHFRAGDVSISLPHGSDSFVFNAMTIEGYPLGIVSVTGQRFLAVSVGPSRTDVMLEQI